MATRSRIIEDVKIILDENEKVYGSLDLDGSISDPDQLETDTLISRLIPVAIDAVSRVASLDYLSGSFTKAGADVLQWEDYDEYCMKAVLPEQFVRVGYVRLGGWKRGVTTLLSEDDPLYAEFFSPFAGVRPTRIYPAAALVMSESGSGFDVVVCPKGDAKDGSVLYVGAADTGDEVEEYGISDKCYWAVMYYIAHLYYVTLGEKQRSDMMEAECYRRLDLETEKEKGDVQ